MILHIHVAHKHRRTHPPRHTHTHTHTRTHTRTHLDITLTYTHTETQNRNVNRHIYHTIKRDTELESELVDVTLRKQLTVQDQDVLVNTKMLKSMEKNIVTVLVWSCLHHPIVSKN